MVSHIPFILNDAGTEAELHLVRSNPMFRAVDRPLRAMLVVNGPDGYVSPDWYEDPSNSQVPTWNYVAIHAKGVLERATETALRDHLDRLSASFEDRLAPKKPWLAKKMPPQKLESMMRAIDVFRFRIEDIDGTWKLNQNKSEAQRETAAAHMKHGPVGHETDALAQMMRGLGPTVTEP